MQDPGGGYKKLIIDPNVIIDSNAGIESGCIYVQFKLEKNQIASILDEVDQNGEGEELKNVVEVSSYSILDEADKIYAGIDKNSNPGNTTPGVEDRYEDDTDDSLPLRLEVANARILKGKVFEDQVTGENPDQIRTDQIRVGNGEYDGIFNGNEEKAIEGVKVKLTETDTGIVYENDEYGNEYITNNNGEFEIKGFIPGNYTVTYIWGNEEYPVQDYKGTIYLEEERQDDPKWWYELTDENAEQVESKYRLSDAIDDYEKRKEIDGKMASVNTADPNLTNEKMESVTALMDIGVEYREEPYVDSMGRMYPYVIDKVDFGIVERARQKMDILKVATGIKVVLSNGHPIVDAKLDEQGNLIDAEKIKWLTAMGPVNGRPGYVKVEMDNELIQGATVEIEYTLKVENNGERDYATEDFYKYGTEGSEADIIKMQADVYDYLDKEMNLVDNPDKNSEGWTEKTKTQYDTQINYGTSKKTIIEDYYEDETSWRIGQETIRELFIEWQSRMQTETVRQIKLQGRTILEAAAGKLEEVIAPGDVRTTKLYATKMLSNNTTEIDLRNDAEITEVNRISNNQTGTLPKVATSQFYDRGQTATITPPTGENRDYIVLIIIGITCFIILTTGIVLIKKKVL